MATVKEIISECGEGKIIEVYAYRYKGHNLHGDYIINVDEVYSEDIYLNKEAADYEVMDEERYNETILANSSMYFSDFFDVNDEILVIILPEDWETDETVETEPITHDKMQMAELLISLPGWDGLSDPKALCEQFTDEQLVDILDEYDMEFSSIEYEGSELEISEEQSERIGFFHDRYYKKIQN